MSCGTVILSIISLWVFLLESVDIEYVCQKCLINIKDGRIPVIALCYGLTFPEIPAELSVLTVIEQRLVSPRHEFMNIRSLGRERQHGLHGMVVNVPIDIDKTVNQLPRTFLQSQNIQLQLFESYHSRNLICTRL